MQFRGNEKLRNEVVVASLAGVDGEETAQRGYTELLCVSVAVTHVVALHVISKGSRRAAAEHQVLDVPQTQWVESIQDSNQVALSTEVNGLSVDNDRIVFVARKEPSVAIRDVDTMRVSKQRIDRRIGVNNRGPTHRLIPCATTAKICCRTIRAVVIVRAESSSLEIDDPRCIQFYGGRRGVVEPRPASIKAISSPLVSKILVD
mmetsp:Transcript_13586/g.25910  ORF Transcript_13586/g.25910 Transcript_13586/m.25910 type:complete len:204 (-) Transcript_13586:98-709(-)